MPRSHTLCVARQVAEVSLKAPISYNPAGDTDILVLDCGLRVSQLKCLCERGAPAEDAFRSTLPTDRPLSLTAARLQRSPPGNDD